MSREALVLLLNDVSNLLARYYNFSERPNFDDFLVPYDAQFIQGGRVLWQEQHGEAFASLQLGAQVWNEFGARCFSVNALTTIAEEVSHLHLLLDAVCSDSRISMLDLEVQGEIDRFLILLHWNAFQNSQPVNENYQNIHDLCDRVFSGKRFPENVSQLYLDAEGMALIELKKAFEREWDYSRFDPKCFSQDALCYLNGRRESILSRGQWRVTA